MADVLKEKKKKEYNEYVKKVTPVHSLWKNMCGAFLVGGAICTAGQLIINTAVALGLDEKSAATWCSVLLVLASVILTSCGAYQRLAKFGGAGTLVPITGFANSVAAPAIEFQKEGQVFGIGCKIFTIAGPVILYGIFSGWVLGVIYWVLTLMK
ncbi:MAG: SpoVA/SpoVAEb family sporulation membrane protein [Eubacteriales bacterium]|nr:SpoVA/SpoVAEb family sporulation membrane protein [Eubacteriales bacterium]